MSHDAAVEDLIALGRRKGALTPEDLRSALPIDAMSAQEIARVLARLEEAGCPVEIDEDLLQPGHRPATIPFPQPDGRILETSGPEKSVPPQIGESSSGQATPAHPEPARPEPRSGFSWLLILLGVLVLIAIVVALIR